ncbi:hypothetical protein MNO14_02255 [Luteimonas sp. S4-F44]|uniref:hypothetical protein n=1 Tax=Luteimonas sp. S4-F44 TaxID=2925842 RepID=UPI001F52F22F|nr:hypothetical protein [Luteimonas sp. S4-F44]UNK42948.1 hypothetical protein MNO14_02255 [Luteimonas sp. S4-F44]
MARATYAFALLTVLAACAPVSGDAEVEVSRLPSPDGMVDAVLTEGNPGATASFVYRVHVVPRGEAPSQAAYAAQLYGATRSPSAYGVDLHWREPDVLDIRYLQARSIDVPARVIDVSGRKVSIVLQDGVENTDARAGGMAPRD